MISYVNPVPVFLSLSAFLRLSEIVSTHSESFKEPIVSFEPLNVAVTPKSVRILLKSEIFISGVIIFHVTLPSVLFIEIVPLEVNPS